MTALHVSLGDDGVALLTIDVPDRPLNVITPELTRDLAAAVERIGTDPAIRGAVFTSGKPGAFIAGADLKDLVDAFGRGVSAADGAAFSQEMSQIYRRLETIGKPIAVAINGLALGGGLEWCLACHYRVLSDDTKAVVGFPEVTVGLLPGGGGTQRLSRLIGIPAALALLQGGRPIKPAQALAQGVVHELAPADAVVARARAWVLSGAEASQPWDRKGYSVPGGAGTLAPHAVQSFAVGNAAATANGARNYPAPLAIQSCVYEGTLVGIDAGLRIESKYFGKLLAHPVARNLIRTLFINKQAADKLSARPLGVPTSKAQRVGVLGAGMMGAGIAHVSAAAGIEVILLDSALELAERGKAGIAELENKDLQRGRTSADKVAALLARIKPTADYADLAGCDLVIEAVFEDRQIKADVTRKTEAVIPADAVFGSNTSTLPISGLASASVRPDQFIGIHFFSPVQKMPLVEVILGERTSEATLARALDYIAQLRKTPIVVRDFPGFFTSRVFITFTHEGMKMLEDGVEPALIENAARQAGFAVGPLAVSDEVTLTLMQRVAQQQDADGLPDKYRSRTARAVIDRMIDELKRPGRRFGGGFYDYPDDGQKRLWPDLAAAYPPAAEQPEVEELKRRFLNIMAMETARCVEDGVIERPQDADIGSLLGIGYPNWTGGTLSYIDTVGIQAFVADCRRMAQQYGPRFEPSPWLEQRAARNEGFY